MLRTATILLSTVLLCGCVTNAPSDVVFPAAATPAASAQAAPTAEPAPGAQTAAAAPAAQAASAPATRTLRAQPAGRAARAVPVPAESSSDDGPLTVTRAREQCWMASESDKAARADLDKKVKWVEQCVEKKMNASIGR